MQIIQKGVFLIFALMLLLPCFQVQAVWYLESLEDGSYLDGSDIIMMDLRWPWWPSGTYYANWNTGFNPKPNNLSFYAGIQSWLADGPNYAPNPDETLQQAFRPGNTWSLWGSDEDGTPPRFVDVGPTLGISNVYGGEGTSAYLAAMPWPFIKNDRWYTMLGRVWQPAGGGDHAYCGRWIKDHADGKWYLMGVAWLPIPATSFHGNAGFIEPLSSPTVVRPLHRRFGYCRKDGQWMKANRVTPSNILYVVAETLTEGDHEYVGIEYSHKPDQLPWELSSEILDIDQTYNFITTQPTLPALDAPAVTNVQAETTGSQVAVSWEVPDTVSPAFAYKIEVFDNPECSGVPAAVKEQYMPTVRHAILDVDAASTTVRLTVTDIFDQTADPVVIQAADAEPAVPVQTVAGTIAGLSYELYYKDTRRQVNFWYDPLITPNEEHYWQTLDEINSGYLFRQGLARGFDLGLLEQRSQGYAMIFDGYLRVPADGLYILHGQIDGAWKIEIDGESLLVRDGQYGTNEKSAICHLAAGDHPILITYLYDAFPGLFRGNFNIEWEGSGLSREPIPLEALRVANEETLPQETISGVSVGDGTGQITVAIDPRSRTVNKTVLYLGDLQLASSDGAGLYVESPFFEGENTLWARVLFDGNYTVDSEPFVLTVTGEPVDSAWTVRNVGDLNAPAGLWQTGEQAFQFFGDGMHTVMKSVTGDFTATMRIDTCSGLNGEPVNSSSWVSLAAFQYPDNLNWTWGQSFYLAQTARNGLRTIADFSDGAGGRVSSYALPAGRPWLRIVRQGDIWTAWTSVDGEQWEIGAYQFRRTPSQMHVGLFFRALSQDSEAHFQASVSQLSIESGAASDSLPPIPPVASNTDGDRLTGVVMALSDASIAVVRSSELGLLRTTDDGATWTSANGDLIGSDLAVRSVAIHPTDPLIMLRACGVGNGAGSLWKTTDGGASWNKLTFPGDFDGIGPSALCGEVVAFDVYDPETLYAGTESKGFFKSTNGGATWTELKLLYGISLAGHRITSLEQWPWYDHHPSLGDTPQLCLTTAGDHWMGFLGRGTPTTITQPTTSRSIFSDQSNPDILHVIHERTDTGFYNCTTDVASMGFMGTMVYATTHGLQGEYGNMAVYPEQKNLEWMRPMTTMESAARGIDEKFGRTIAQVLDPATPGRFSISYAWAFSWSWLEPICNELEGGLIAVAGDEKLGDKWWFVYTDGLYYSPNGGMVLQKILDNSGNKSESEQSQSWDEPVIITSTHPGYNAGYSIYNLIAGDSGGPITSYTDTFDSSIYYYGNEIQWEDDPVPTVSNPVEIVYDFGEAVPLRNLVLWNWCPGTGSYGRGIKAFSVTFSNDDITYTGDVSFTAAIGTNWLAEPSQVFEFSPVTARYAKIVATSNYGDPAFAAMAELHFNDLAIPLTPDPADGETGVAIDTTLSWSLYPESPYNPSGYDVYFGTAPDAMTQIGSNQTAATADPGPLDFNTTYYCQVDIYEGTELASSRRWTFTTADPPSSPQGATVAAGGIVDLSVSDVLVPLENEVTYTWYKETDPNNLITNGGDISGADTDTLTIANVDLSDEGYYYCVISSAQSSVTIQLDSALLITERLVSRWTFDGTLEDAVGSWDGDYDSPVPGNLDDSLVTYVTGADGTANGAIFFDGDIEWVDIPGSEEYFNFHPRGVTVTAWVRNADGNSGDYARIIEKDGDLALITHNNGDIRGQISNYGWMGLISGTQAGSDWSLVVLSYDPDAEIDPGTVDVGAAGGYSVYLNGSETFGVVQGDKVEGLPDTPGSYLIRIGASNTLYTNYQAVKNVEVDDVRLYSYALSPQEIAQLYNEVTGQAICAGLDLETLTSDLNDDCQVDIADLVIMVAQWLDNNVYYK